MCVCSASLNMVWRFVHGEVHRKNELLHSFHLFVQHMLSCFPASLRAFRSPLPGPVSVTNACFVGCNGTSPTFSDRSQFLVADLAVVAMCKRGQTSIMRSYVSARATKHILSHTGCFCQKGNIPDVLERKVRTLLLCLGTKNKARKPSLLFPSSK